MPDHALIMLALAAVIVAGVVASELHGRRRPRPEISSAFARVLAGQVAAGLAVQPIESDLHPESVGYRRHLRDVERIELARARVALLAIGTMIGNASRPPDPVVGETLKLAERSLDVIRERPAQR